MFYEFKHFGSGDYFVKEYGENFNFAPHMHLCFEFITLLEGEMKITVDGHDEVLKSGEGLLIFPNQLHSLSSVNSRHMLCIFSPDLVRAFTQKIENKFPQSNHFAVERYMAETLEGLSDHSSILAKKGFLYSLCAKFDEGTVYLPRQINRKGLLPSIFAFVEENYKENCTLAALAAQMGYDYAYLSRYFKHATGISFTEYLNRYRLNKACYLLDNTDESILKCALEVGYNSLRTFNRNFKKEFSISPATYRKDGM